MFNKLKFAVCILTIQICILFFNGFKIYADDAVSGTLSSGVSWTISDSVMTFSGNGEMGDIRYQPYSSYSSTVTSVIINDGITSVGYGAFSNFAKLKSVTLPNSVEYIDMNAFSYCYNLVDINIPDSVNYIGNAAFYGTYFISRISDDFVILGDGILYDYKGSDEKIIIPDGVKSVTDRIFTSNSSITSVYIPNSVRKIGDNAFLNCSNLKYAVISSGVNYFGNNSFGYILNPAPVIDSNFKMYGILGSDAHDYAVNNGIAFSAIGDFNNDNDITSYDALAVLQGVTGITDFNDEQKIIADVNNDGEITSYDALLILQYTVNLTEEW